MLTLCERCQKPQHLCVCDSLTPIETKTEILILQHPQEPDKDLGTAHIAHLMLPSSTLKVGLSWRSLKAIIGREVNHSEWGVLYLGSAKVPAGFEAPLCFVSRKGTALPPEQQREIAQKLKGIVVLDGTWSQAKALWWRNAWLLKLRRMVLNPAAPSLYGKLRKEPRRESVSTLESIGAALGFLEHDPTIPDRLSVPFKALLHRYRAGKR